MNKENRNKILKNCHYLAENTSNLPVLLNMLQKKQILETIERQTIISKPTDYEKYTELYSTVIKKGDDALEALLNSLNQSGNQLMAIKIQQSNGNQKFIWFNIKQLTKYYKGRDQEMNTIMKCWEKTRKENSLMFMTITGLGGVGKSELARNFTKKFYMDIKGHCIWINAESSQTIYISFQKLANKIGISLMDHAGKEKSVESLAPQVYDKVCNEKCLFILDNADNVEGYESTILRSLVEYSSELPPDQFRPFGLLTSRYKLVSQFFGDLATHLPLHVLTEEAAVSFFVDALSITEEDLEAVSKIKVICNTLKFFPLAMQQAVAYIRAQNKNPEDDVKIGIHNYLEDFDKQTKKLLDYPLPKLQILDEVSKTTYLTWQVTLNTLGQNASNALNVIAFFHSENIDADFATEVIKIIFPKSINEATHSINILEMLDEYSMCQIRKEQKKATLSVHRLVQQVIRIRLDEEGKLYQLLDKLLTVVMKMLSLEKINLINMIHIETIWEHALKSTHLMKKYAYMAEMITHVYIEGGRYRPAFEFTCRTIGHFESLFGREDRQTLKMMFHKGRAAEHLGEYSSAKILLEEVFEKQKVHFGKDDSDTLGTQGALCNILWRQGNYDEASEALKQPISRRESIDGKNDIETLKLKHDRALALRYEGKNQEALSLFEEVLAIRISQSGEEHIHVLSTMNNIGLVLLNQGKIEDALKMFTKAFRGREKVLGKEHPETLVNIGNMATALTDLGKFTEAMKLQEEVLTIQKRILEKHHPDTLTTMNNIGDLLAKLGKPNKALEILNEILPVRVKKLGYDHSDTLTTMNNIGFALFNKRKYEEALAMFKRILKVHEQNSTLDRTEALLVKANIGHLLNQQGKLEEALKIFREVLQKYVKILGINHPSTLVMMQTCANVLLKQGKPEEALRMTKLASRNKEK